MAEDGGSLNPESITVLDPACGSGHILVEAYEVLKAIYLERGYQARAIPRLILEKNLFGLDIDDRAAQMAGFALMVKAGMTPLQSIQAATVAAADHFSLTSEIGTIAAGKAADIIAVDGDPLSNVRELESVDFVMKGGKVFKD